jgi:hypothetical protein
MGDGTWEAFGLLLCTDAFTTPDVVRLMNVLMVRYNIACTLRYHVGKSANLYSSFFYAPITILCCLTYGSLYADFYLILYFN